MGPQGLWTFCCTGVVLCGGSEIVTTFPKATGHTNGKQVTTTQRLWAECAYERARAVTDVRPELPDADASRRGVRDVSKPRPFSDKPHTDQLKF